MESTLLPRKTSSPPGRSTRAASGIDRYGSAQMAAPYSLIARSNASSAKGRCSAAPRISVKRRPNSRCRSPAISSWLGVGSSATGRAPRRASQAEMYPVPHPSSIVRSPPTSVGRRPTSASGIAKMPQVGSSRAHARRPARRWSSAWRVQTGHVGLQVVQRPGPAHRKVGPGPTGGRRLAMGTRGRHGASIASNRPLHRGPTPRGGPCTSRVCHLTNGEVLRACSAEPVISRGQPPGCSAAWQRACFGSRRSGVQIPASRPRRLTPFGSLNPEQGSGRPDWVRMRA